MKGILLQCRAAEPVPVSAAANTKLSPTVVTAKEKLEFYSQSNHQGNTGLLYWVVHPGWSPTQLASFIFLRSSSLMSYSVKNAVREGNLDQKEQNTTGGWL